MEPAGIGLHSCAYLWSLIVAGCAAARRDLVNLRLQVYGTGSSTSSWDEAFQVVSSLGSPWHLTILAHSISRIGTLDHCLDMLILKFAGHFVWILFLNFMIFIWPLALQQHVSKHFCRSNIWNSHFQTSASIIFKNQKTGDYIAFPTWGITNWIFETMGLDKPGSWEIYCLSLLVDVHHDVRRSTVQCR